MFVKAVCAEKRKQMLQSFKRRQINFEIDGQSFKIIRLKRNSKIIQKINNKTLTNLKSVQQYRSLRFSNHNQASPGVPSISTVLKNPSMKALKALGKSLYDFPTQ